MLLDIDKNSDDRGTPMPNTHDVLIHSSVPAKGTNSVNYLTPASFQSTLSGGKNGQFTVISVSSFTTTATYTTTNPGAGAFAADNFVIYEAAHNLPFAPGALAYEQKGDGTYSAMPYIQYLTAAAGTEALWTRWAFFMDGTNVYIFLYTMTFGNSTWSILPGFIFKWYLLYQTSN